jgi:hypothetical protein
VSQSTIKVFLVDDSAVIRGLMIQAINLDSAACDTSKFHFANFNRAAHAALIYKNNS